MVRACATRQAVNRQTLARAVEDADAIIWACGYLSNLVPILGSHGHQVWRRGEIVSHQAAAGLCGGSGQHRGVTGV
jgi:hypothetical protein